METKVSPTYWAHIYMSGPIEVAKQVIRQECMRAGWCVTIDPTTFIYTGGEEAGFVVGMINYPRFPAENAVSEARAMALMNALLDATHQWSALLVTAEHSTYITKREPA